MYTFNRIRAGNSSFGDSVLARLAMIAAKIARQGIGLARNLKTRHDIRAMYRLEDRMLDDIGIERADIQRALMVPWYDDPRRSLEAARDAHRRERIRRLKMATAK